MANLIFYGNGFYSRNLISIYKNGCIYNTTELTIPSNNSIYAYYKGLEDVRLVVWDNKLYAYGTRWDKIENKGCMCVYELDNKFKPVNEIIVPPQNGGNCEKNWGAIEDKPFTFVYLNNPMTIVQINEKGDCWLVEKKDKIEEIKGFLKGSTPIVRYNDEMYISLVHMNDCYSKDDVEYSDYLTAIVFYDNDLNIIKMSDWFVFKSPMCEFSCGLAVKDNDICITYSEFDCTPHLLVTNKNVLENFMNCHDAATRLYTFYDIYNEAKYNESINQIVPASVLYNYAFLLCQADSPNEMKLECLIKALSNIVKHAVYFEYLISKTEVIDYLHDIVNKYPDCCEFYYLLSYMYRIIDNMDEANKYKELGNRYKLNIHNYFFKYFNPNYL